MSVEQLASIYSDVNSFDQTIYSKRTSTLQTGDEYLRVVTITRPTDKLVEQSMFSPLEELPADPGANVNRER